MSVSPGYLDLFRIPVLRGRDITENDKAGAPNVLLINEALARKCWLNQDPIGQHITDRNEVGGVETIIGIVADSHNSGLGRPADPMMMVPIAQVTDFYNAAYANIQPLFWVVRTHGDPHSFIPAVTEQLRIASAEFPVGHIRTMDEVMGRSMARQSFTMLLLAILARPLCCSPPSAITQSWPTPLNSGLRRLPFAWRWARIIPILKFVVRQGMSLALVASSA